MSENINRLELLEKIKNQIEDMNEYQLELESEMSKSLYIDDSIPMIDELKSIERINENLISQIRALGDIKTDNN